MYEQITNEELLFCEHFFDPVSLKECLYPENLKACHSWLEDDTPLYQVRPYQMAWQNYSLMYADDDTLTAKENIRRKKGAGTCYNIGARNTGKSFDFLIPDVPLTILDGEGDESCLGSATDHFLDKICSPILNIFREHPFFEIYHKSGKSNGIKSGNKISIETIHGHKFYGINEKITDPEPGTKFHGLHYKTLFYEEASYQSEAGTENRVDSGSSLGAIERFSGIPDLRIGSPLGDLLYNPENKKYICRLPQMVREDFDDDEEKRLEDKYNGKTSLAYKLNVLGEIVEGAEGFWDIDRVRKKCLNKSLKIKNFDLDKEKFKNFEKYIIVDRIPAEQIFICLDVGMGGRPTEIIIVFFDGLKYKYRYNISLNKLTAKEQAKIIKHLYDTMGSAFIGIDATTDYGIAEELKFLKVPSEYICSIDLRKKMEFGFETDDSGKIKMHKGKPIIKEQKAIEHAMQELETLIYDGLMDIPIDQKFIKEFTGFKVTSTGLTRKYGSTTTDDLHQAFQIFAITRALKEFEVLKNNKRERPPLGFI